jgi:hypothetical protein
MAPPYKGKIIARSGNIALIFGGGGWEVVVIQIKQKPHTFPSGKTLESGSEYLPSSEQWGTLGWSPGPEPWARAYFDALVKADNTDKDYRNAVALIRAKLQDLEFKASRTGSA